MGRNTPEQTLDGASREQLSSANTHNNLNHNHHSHQKYHSQQVKHKQAQQSPGCSSSNAGSGGHTNNAFDQGLQFLPQTYNNRGM